jgi:hypothetical protein
VRRRATDVVPMPRWALRRAQERYDAAAEEPDLAAPPSDLRGDESPFFALLSDDGDVDDPSDDDLSFAVPEDSFEELEDSEPEDSFDEPEDSDTLASFEELDSLAAGRLSFL